MNFDELKFLLKTYNLTPNKIRGQNFLVSEEVLDDILATSHLTEQDLVMEVGPGLGALTQRLVGEAGRVVAFEVDENFAQPLNKLASVSGNLEIIWQDILSLSEDAWQEILKKNKTQNYKIVANIPYYLTGKFIQKFIFFKSKPETMVLMLQREVAERIIVKDKKESLLSLSVNFYAKSEIVSLVPKNNFYPEPQVDSAIVSIYDIHDWRYQVDEKKTWQLIKRGFAHKRKKLFNNLLTDPNLDRAKLASAFSEIGLDLNIRAEKLSRENWLKLAKILL